MDCCKEHTSPSVYKVGLALVGGEIIPPFFVKRGLMTKHFSECYSPLIWNIETVEMREDFGPGGGFHKTQQPTFFIRRFEI